MFRNRTDFEQCQNRALLGKTCYCDYVYSNNDLLTSVFIGMISGILGGLGIITLWKYKYVALDTTIKARKCSCKWFKEKFFSVFKNMEMVIGFLLTYAVPPVFKFMADNSIAESDSRIIKSSHIMFTFISTLIIAICFYPDFFDHDQKTKVSIRISVLICFSGNILTLGHMPYEEIYETVEDYYFHFKKIKIIVYYSICAALAIFSFFYIPSEYKNPYIPLETLHENNNNQVDGNSENFISRFYNFLIHQVSTTKGSLLLQAIFLMSANALTNFALDFIFEHLFKTKSRILLFLLILTFLVIVFGAFFYLKTKIYFKDPIFMAVMICNVDVFNRVLYVLLFYFHNFSLSFADKIQFGLGFFATICGLIGLLLNQGLVVEEYINNYKE